MWSVLTVSGHVETKLFLYRARKFLVKKIFWVIKNFWEKAINQIKKD